MRAIRLLATASLMSSAFVLCGCGRSGSAPKPSGAPGAVTPNPVVPGAPIRSGQNAVPPAATAPTVSTQQLMVQAQTLFRQGNVAQAISTLEQIAAAEPQNREALAALIQLTTQQGSTAAQRGNQKQAAEEYLKAGKYARQLRSAIPHLTEQDTMVLAQGLYNEACGYALTGQSDKAIAALDDALEAGFSDLNHVAQDSDLNSLRDLPAYRKLMQDAPAKLAARAKRHAKELIAEHKPFDFDFALSDLEGKTVSLKDFAGKVLIVDIWGTWCPPCRMEIPHFVALHKQYREAGLEVVGVNYEQVPPDKVNETIANFVKENSVTYPCVIGTPEIQAQVPEFSGFPTTLFIDSAGKVRAKLVGLHSFADLEGIVTTLLDEKKAAPLAN